jgi:hypothetical protein
MSVVGCAIAAGLCLLAGWTAVRKLQHLTAAAPHSSDKQVQECVAFLQQHMPERDRVVIDHKMLVHHARLALKARKANSWAAAVPWDIFLNDVLPYRNLDEPIDINWRSMFLQRFGPMVAAASSLTEAAQLLNRWALPHMLQQLAGVQQVSSMHAYCVHTDYQPTPAAGSFTAP